MHGIDVANELLRECSERIAEVTAELRGNPLRAVGEMDADAVRNFLQSMPADARAALLDSALVLVASAVANGFARCRWSLYSGDVNIGDDDEWEEKTADMQLDQGMTIFCPFDECSMVSIDLIG